MVQLIHSISETRAAIRESLARGEKIGFVPTMGALHRGHLSLVEASLEECDRTVVSIFVNPTQFEPSEDLDRYPRTLEEDVRLLEKMGCWLVFAPSTEEMYGDGIETTIDVGAVTQPWEGAARPNHFQGVATVVLKLFQIVPAERAYFGQKDYQQTLVVKQMVSDLSLPIEICVRPTMREPDGLAMSSRNAYLNPQQREQAASLWQALLLAEKLHESGERNSDIILRKMREQLQGCESLKLEYLAILKEGTVFETNRVEGRCVVVLAARLGETRLIDNHIIGSAP